MQATVSLLVLYFALLHLEIHLVTIVETTSNSDDVDERYRMVTSKNRPNPSHVYAEFVDERVDVDSSGGGQGATTSSAGLEDDAASTLSEHIELSESRALRDGEDSEEESEESLKWAAKGIFASHTSPTYITGVVVPYTTYFRPWMGSTCTRRRCDTKDAMHNAFESIGDAESQVPFDLYYPPAERRGTGVDIQHRRMERAEGGDAHPVFSDRRVFLRRSEPPRWLKLNTYSRVESSAMRFETDLGVSMVWTGFHTSRVTSHRELAPMVS
ncbi:hypothetical protein EDB84DRAFT_1439830 [Lactarius hengduanensis]|nr:hypothetical protein EDB84DRAFT_1439830 [Lactarius hengduanensis]